MKNKFFKTINLAFILSLAFFSSCNLDNKNLDDRDKESKKENINLTDSINPNEDKNEEKTDNISKNDRKDKKFTENLVVDREIWKEISNQEIKEKASLQISGIHLPKILLHSEDAKKANEEIDDLAEKVKDAYEDSIENASDLAEDLNKFVSSTYSFYQDDKILSIFIDMTKDPFDENEKYKIYNFSLPEGDLIKDTEVLKNLGLMMIKYY